MELIYKLMKIQVLIVAVISSFILYGCEDNEADYLELSESSFGNVSGDGATLTVNITSDVEWQVSKTAQWCSITPGKGSGNQTLTLQIEANPDSKERRVTVTVASPSIQVSRKIEITQAAGYTPIEQHHYKLPVVFHVLYHDKSDPEQYVRQSRLSEILNTVNRLYKNSTQSVDMNLTFTLATVNPDGEAMEQPGVEYIAWPENYPIDCDVFMNDDISEATGKGYVRYLWDPNRYINIMVYNFANDPNSNTTTLGISHLPFTVKGANSLAGLSEINVSHLELENLSFPYCVSINSLFINEESTGNTYNTADITVTLAHELGHYLGLHHVFSETENENSCEDTDYCADTPTYNKKAYDMDCAYIKANNQLHIRQFGEPRELPDRRILCFIQHHGLCNQLFRPFYSRTAGAYSPCLAIQSSDTGPKSRSGSRHALCAKRAHGVTNPYRQIGVAIERKKEMNNHLFISFSNIFIRSNVFPASVEGNS